MKNKTNTNKFVASHGHEPKGSGWWFFEIHFTDGQGRFSSEKANGFGTLAKARASAWKDVKAHVGGAKELVQVDVLP